MADQQLNGAAAKEPPGAQAGQSHHRLHYAKLIKALFQVGQILYTWRFREKPPGAREIFR